MSLLDDARRLVFTPWIRQDGYAECANCGASRQPDEDRDIVHNPDCSWLVMPRIVAALEAATELLRRPYQALSQGWGADGWYCVACNAEALDPDTIAHEPTCPRPILETLLRGDPS